MNGQSIQGENSLKLQWEQSAEKIRFLQRCHETLYDSAAAQMRPKNPEWQSNA